MSYTVNVTREDGAWIADAPDVPGAHTWARNLMTLEADIREAIALSLDIPESETSTIALDLQFEDVDHDVARSAVVRQLRAKQQELEAQIASESLKLIPLLAEKSFSVRDIAVMLAISPGRVSQLAPQVVAQKKTNERKAVSGKFIAPKSPRGVSKAARALSDGASKSVRSGTRSTAAGRLSSRRRDNAE